ncbi:MAG: helix-turn-helix transcriptional regulator [Clostridia bacterium]|nr:helix-turn-helix transcriptional regulator [Clostridia bacterium]
MFRLKELRSQKGQTQKEVAKILGISPQSLGYYENEINKPDPEMLIKLADYYNCSIDYLVGREDDLGIVQAQIVSPTLTKEETELLLAYKTLSSKGKNLLSELAKRIEISERR